MVNHSPKPTNHVDVPPTDKNKAVTKWAVSSRIFHWISAVLLIVIWGLFVAHEQTDLPKYMDLHRAFGVSMLFWTLARIINRFVTKTPPSVPMPTWQTALAHLTHYGLYALLVAMPIAGILMTMYAGRSIDMFGWFDIPSLVETNRSTARFYNKLHTGIIWSSIITLTALHIVGAVYHQFIIKDNLIKRML